MQRQIAFLTFGLLQTILKLSITHFKINIIKVIKVIELY